MIRQLLAPVGCNAESRRVFGWGIELARPGGAELTVVPMIDPDAWKAALPVVMTAGYAARMLEQRPWEGSSARMRDLEIWCREKCAESGVACSFSQPGHHPLEWLAGLSHSHDLVLFPAVDGEGLSRLIRRVAAPVLSVQTEPEPVKRVWAAYDGSPESARTIKQYATMRLWPEAPVELVWTQGDPSNAAAALSSLANYCRAHNHEVRLAQLEGDPGDWLERAGGDGAGLLVAPDSNLDLLRRTSLPVFMSH